MKELYFLRSYKINHRTIDSVMDGYHIEVEGYRYERLNAKPRGRSIEKRLRSMDEQTQLVLYS